MGLNTRLPDFSGWLHGAIAVRIPFFIIVRLRALITHRFPCSAMPPHAASRFSVNAFCDERLREEQKGFYESGTLTKLSYLGTRANLNGKALKEALWERGVVACLLFQTALD